MEFITCKISFPDCGLLEKSEAAVEFRKSKRNCSSCPAALYSAFGHHISIRLYSSNFVFLYCIVYSTMYRAMCVCIYWTRNRCLFHWNGHWGSCV